MAQRFDRKPKPPAKRTHCEDLQSVNVNGSSFFLFFLPDSISEVKSWLWFRLGAAQRRADERYREGDGETYNRPGLRTGGLKHLVTVWGVRRPTGQSNQAQKSRTPILQSTLPTVCVTEPDFLSVVSPVSSNDNKTRSSRSPRGAGSEPFDARSV